MAHSNRTVVRQQNVRRRGASLSSPPALFCARAASATTWGAVEPIQVLMIATLPLIIKEDSCAGRCFERVRTVYNEIFA